MNPALLALTYVLSINAQAQTDSYQKFLLPVVVFAPAAGAFGSLWSTELWLEATDGDVVIRGTPGCGACLPTIRIPAGHGEVYPAGHVLTEPIGEIMYVSRDTAQNAVFNLRLVDISRQSLTWGTEIPVVTEVQFRSDSEVIILPNIPLDSRFRSALRIYDVDSGQNTSFGIDIFDQASGTQLVSNTSTVQPAHVDWIPSIVQITDLRSAFNELGAVQLIRIVVRPLTPGTRFWAFVTVTNNELRVLTRIFFILRNSTNRVELKNAIVRTNRGVTFDHAVRANAGALAYLDLRANDAVGAYADTTV